LLVHETSRSKTAAHARRNNRAPQLPTEYCSRFMIFPENIRAAVSVCRDSLYHFGFARDCAAKFVMPRRNLVKKFLEMQQDKAYIRII